MPNSCFKHSILLLLIVLLNSTLWGQKYYFKKIGTAEGLSHSSVFCIAQDHKGWMWFGTRGGLDVFNGSLMRTYHFNTGLPNVEAQRVNSLLALGQELYVGTGMGLLRYDFSRDKLVPVKLSASTPIFVNQLNAFSGGMLVSTNTGLYTWHKQQARAILVGKNVRGALEYKQNVLMVLEEEKIRLLNVQGEAIFDFPVILTPETSAPVHIETLYKDPQGQIWAGTSAGLYHLDASNLVFKQPSWFPHHTELVRSIVGDQQGQLWIGTESGVFVFNPLTQALSHYEQSYDASLNHLSDKAIYSTFVSRDGIVWLGTYFAGVNYALPHRTSFDFMLPNTNQSSLSGKAVSEMVSDAQQNLWIATEDGGVTILDQQLKLHKILNKNNGLSENNVHAILPENNGTVWIGTFRGGLNKIDTKTGAIAVFKPNENKPNSISNNSVYAICRDQDGLLWIGTQSGLNLYDEKTDTWTLPFAKALGNKFIYDIHEDREGHLWVATRYDGLYRLDRQRKQLKSYRTEQIKGFKSNQFIGIYEDSRGNLWFASLEGGICKFRLKTGQFEVPKVQLPSQTVYGILEDEAHFFWLSTNKGLVKYDPQSGRSWTFDLSSGLLTTQFNFKSAFKNQAGVLFFGTVNGLAYFQPLELAQHISNPKCYFTGLKIFNRPIEVGQSSVLQRHLDETPAIELAYRQNVLSIDFVALNYFADGNNYYTYYLEGFEPGWNPKTSKNTATYTNLPAGEFTFHLKSFRSDGSLASDERRLRIKIRPPFWRSPLAYLFYTLLVALGGYGYFRFNRFVSAQKLAVQIERLDKEKNVALHQQKLNFFNFISNEFKTPLTLITAALEQIMGKEVLQRTDLAQMMPSIRRNAQHLELLTEQLAALQKNSENPEEELVQLDLVEFVQENLAAFQPLIVARQLQLEQSSAMPYLSGTLDANKLELVLGHLWFSIFSKIEPEQSLEISLSAKKEAGDSWLVLDHSGALPPEVYNSLQLENEGSTDHSLLLTSSLIKELIQQLKGQIRLEYAGAQTCISLHIPFVASTAKMAKNKQQHAKKASSAWIKRLAEYEIAPVSVQEELPKVSYKSKILLAEKSSELIGFLKHHFADQYEVILANHYAKALEKAETALPELIICDAGMVNDKGESLCQQLKAQPQTGFIPLILLSDADGEQNRLLGLSLGADALLQKPFKLKELDLMVQNMLKSQRLIKEKFAGALPSPQVEASYQVNKSYAFLQKFTQLVEHNYQNPELNVDFLAKAMNCSRSSLHAKLKTLSGLSTVEFLTDYRLGKAQQLLMEGKSVSEAALQVGFGDANYFSRVYKKKYAQSPKQTVKNG